jgi:class 3 adenylate cyclase
MPTFLFTDIEHSTQLWEDHTGVMPDVLERHNELIEGRVHAYDGEVVRRTGDGIFAAFHNGDPLKAALDIQQRISAEEWGSIGDLRVRIVLHAGEAIEQEGDYYGPTVNRTARLLGVCWGGQILLTPEVAHRAALPAGASLEDLGEHLLKDLSRPQQIYMLHHPSLPYQSFPPPRSLSANPDDLSGALRKAVTFQVDSLAMYTLVAVARLMASQGSLERAVELLAFVLARDGTSEFSERRAQQLLAEIEPQISPQAFEAARRRGQARGLADIVDDILRESAE